MEFDYERSVRIWRWAAVSGIAMKMHRNKGETFTAATLARFEMEKP
jgi:hypothetical protein